MKYVVAHKKAANLVYQKVSTKYQSVASRSMEKKRYQEPVFTHGCVMLNWNGFMKEVDIHCTPLTELMSETPMFCLDRNINP